MEHTLKSSTQLEFISDEQLSEFVHSVISKVASAAERAENDLHNNVIDPFSATFDAMYQGITLEEWMRQEKTRQIQKSLQNFIGEFHQNILGSIAGWENLQVGNSIDLRNRDKKIIAEVKNKYNTMNSGSQLIVYDKLQKHLDYDESYKGYTAYCVVIIPPRRHTIDLKYNPSDKGTRRPERQDIRIIDGQSFYKIATGDPLALKKLYMRIPIIINELTGTETKVSASSESFTSLFSKAYSDNV